MTLSELIAKRGLIKAKITRFRTFIDKCNSENKENLLSQLVLRVENVRDSLDDFNLVQDEIDLLEIKESEKAKSTIERTDFEDSYYESIVEAQELIQKYNLNNDNSQQNATINSGHSDSVNLTQPIHVKLPNMEVPTFSGRYEDWLPFRELFKTLLDSQPALDNIHKLYYLHQALKGGNAAHVISSLDLTSENYEIAWQLLTKRYQNERVITENHLKGIFEFPKIERESCASIRKLLDNTNIHLRALKSLNQPTDSWDTLIIHILVSKLDLSTNKEWQANAPLDRVASLSEFTEFLSRRCQTLEAISSTFHSKSSVIQKTDKIESKPTKVFPIKTKTVHYTNVKQSMINECLICSQSHRIFSCPEFNKMLPSIRVEQVKRLNLCFNCLRPGHAVKDCHVTSNCKVCNKKHNTLLHSNSETKTSIDSNSQRVNQSTSDKSQTSSINSSAISCTSQIQNHLPQVLLSTALVKISDSSGSFITCRALLDSGSSINIMTESLCQQLKLNRKRINTSISGIDNINTNANCCVSTKIKSRFLSYENQLDFIVLPKITNSLPSTKIDVSRLSIPKTIFLADPYFHSPAKVDLLLGAEIFFELLCIGQISLVDGFPTLQKTALGWVISGKIPSNTSSVNSFHCTVSEEAISSQLEKFWSIEEVSDDNNQRSLTGEEALCEQIFSDTVQRSDDGKFIVQLPIKPNVSQLGSSKEIALKRFIQLEKRLSKNPELKRQYCNFMKEYETLNHMEKVDPVTIEDPVYYIPHHCVHKHDSTTTKLRVVFDASCKTNNNISLNECMFKGPVVQEELFSIVVRFRKHLYAMTADIEKMYRQILINQDQTRYQLIFWRENPTDEIQTYRLLTVTYGTTSAPYLATRSLKQLAIDHSDLFPEAAQRAISDFYVDDILTGNDSLENSIKLQQQLSELLKMGGFNLRKWCASNDKILEEISPEDCQIHPSYNLRTDDQTVKTLGIYWNSQLDTFQYTININVRECNSITKRTILSEVSKLFDPLGLVSPVILQAKIIVQELWKLNVKWDESIPMQIQNKWLQFAKSLSRLCDLRIPRLIKCKSEIVNLQLHSFSDASELGFGACIYLRSEDVCGNIHVALICSKTRVAPIKKVTIPRLELCGAMLATQLSQKVLLALKLEISERYFWTDSTIVLSWLASASSSWSTFISNRVAKIQRLSNSQEWRHVRSHDNPADYASRGLAANQIIESSLWWNGPEWLSNTCTWREPQDIHFHPDEELPERRLTAFVCLTTDNQQLWQRYSKFSKLQRVVAYILRFCQNSKNKNIDNRSIGPLSVSEMKIALTVILRNTQEHFLEEYNCLKNHKDISSKSKLNSLCPFLDENGLIRVGGRLQHAELLQDQKHPIILPDKSVITKLIFKQEHITQLHAGPLALLASIRLKYWPINGRKIAKRVFHECLTCFRMKPKRASQIMGNLPSQRVQGVRPFLHVGVDYCGPIHILNSHRRGSKSVKGYIAVFVCFATKAIHLELVQELTTKSFLACLDRFISRRGKPAEMFSDNATNFIGAKNELRELYEMFSSSENNVIETCTQNNIKWNFIPPRSPHFGGLWEAGVKSVKYHLTRIIGKASLTYEELYTVICRVEGCLNSRPITPLSNDPSDFNPLTPGHFLVGHPLTATPEPDFSSSNPCRLNRWQRINQLTQHFWNRWRKEYLSQLQSRVKWQATSSNVKPDTMVLLHEDNISPMNWKLGRVIEVIPGSDGKVRVVVVKTETQTLKRAVNKICPLPVCENDEQ